MPIVVSSVKKETDQQKQVCGVESLHVNYIPSIPPDSSQMKQPAVEKRHMSNVVTPRGSIYTSKKRLRCDDDEEEGNLVRGEVQSIGAPLVRRALFKNEGHPVPITPARHLVRFLNPTSNQQEVPPAAKRRLIFGRLVDEIVVPTSVRQVYAIVRKLTGSIGGNASFGPIYGELTMASMQKMVNLMKEHAELNCSSRFIDVGSGIGKPNLHVAQDPGVEFSYGIEVEYDRWMLGMTCLKAVLAAACPGSDIHSVPGIQAKCFFAHADIRQAKVFDPFTHVYMFSIGFPPALWIQLSEMWNRSTSTYLICYHGTRDIIGNYGFEVELVGQTNTSMHGSKEGHTGYIYRRRTRDCNQVMLTSDHAACDPLFKKAWNHALSDPTSLQSLVEKLLNDSTTTGGPSTRTRRRAAVSDMSESETNKVNAQLKKI